MSDAYVRFHLFVTGKGERSFVGRLLRPVVAEHNATFTRPEYVGQSTPRKEHLDEIEHGEQIVARHVAVVTAVISARMIKVDHANWLNRGEISLGVPVEDPPAHLHDGHHHQDERGQLKDARRFHSIAASASRSACAKRVRSALLCASDRKQAS